MSLILCSEETCLANTNGTKKPDEPQMECTPPLRVEKRCSVQRTLLTILGDASPEKGTTVMTHDRPSRPNLLSL